MKTYVKNSSSVKQVKNAERKQNLRELDETDDMRKVLETVEGRRVLWKILSQCGVFRSSVEHSGSMTYFNEGRRDIGLFLINEINNANSVSFSNMMKENNHEVIE